MKRGSIESAMYYHKIVLLLVGILVAVGIYGLWQMPKQEFPTFTVRQGLVVALYPGATSEEVEQQVAKPLEEYLFSFKEVRRDKTFSTSQDGLVIVNVELNDDVQDKDAFWSKCKHGLSAFKRQLPSGVVALEANDDFGDTSALLITFESEDKTYRELQTYMEQLEERLRQLPAVSGLRRYGWQHEQICVYLDQDKMAQYGIGSYTLIQNLFMQGFTTASGSVDNDRFVAPIHIRNDYNWERDVAEQIVYSDPSGNVIRLRDIARVEKRYPNPDSYILNNGKKCILLSMEMREGNNIVELGHRLDEILADFQQTLPDDVSIYRITDQSQVVGDSVATFLRELLIAVLSVILVVILLMPLRVAYVAASSIPITIFISLALFYLFEIELNTVTLAALIVTLGMVVDDSIVIIDNYMEKLDEGMSRWHAAIASPREFFLSVLSATMAISITFFPFLFTTHGMLYEFLKSFPWAITIILGISLSVALLVIPFLQYTIIRRGMKADVADGKRHRHFSLLDKMQGGYEWLLKRCFAHPARTLSAGVVAIAVGVGLFLVMPQRMMPIAERNQFAVEFFLPKGTAAERTAQVADSLAILLRQDPRVLSVTTFVGSGSPRFHTTYAPQIGGKNFAQFIVNTKGNRETEEVLDAYADRYADYFPDAYVRFKQMDYSDARFPFEIRLSGDSIPALKEVADTVMACMRTIDGLQLIRTDYGEQLPGVSVRLDEAEVNRLGLNKALVSMALAVHFGEGVPMTTVWDGDYPMQVLLKSERAGEARFSQIPDEYIPAMNGLVSVPLRQIATVVPDYTEGEIVRRNGVRTLSVLAEAERGRNIVDLTRRIQEKLPELRLPEGVQVSVGGMEERDNELMPQIFSGLALAFCIIFFILLFHFKQIKLALLVLGSVTLCTFGAAVGLTLRGMDLSVTGILGVVSLMGILVRNGIIMFDYAEELRRDEQMPVKEAAYHAGVRRLRPIFLTSAAASMGVVMMMLEGGSLWMPLGTVIFFGTLISMVLIATMLPVAYWLIFRGEDNRPMVNKTEVEQQ